MLEALLGSTNKERVLVYLHTRDEGYAREISRFFQTDVSQIQKQLEKLENSGVLYSRELGKTRVYGLNPRYPFLTELRALIEKVLSFYPQEERQNLLMIRRRPRRKGKPL